MLRRPLFGSYIDFPNSEKKEFSVSSVEDGYKFVFYNEKGEEDGAFSINGETTEHLYAATGYTGKEAEAIETFRKYGQEKWPERFRPAQMP